MPNQANSGTGTEMTEAPIDSVVVAPGAPLTVREMQLAEVDIRI